MRPFCSCRWRRASASLIRRASLATTFFICATSSGVSAKSGLSARTSRVSFSPGPVGPALQLALHVLADHAAEGLQPQLQVVADAGELAGVEAPRLQRLHDLLDVALDGRPVELVGDAAAEVADLQEVHQPLEAGVLGAPADGHLHLAPLPAHEQLGQLVEVEVLLVGQPVELVLHLGVLGAERLLEPLAERLEVEEVEVEDPVERLLVAGLLDQRGGQRGLEGLAVGQADLGARAQGVERLGGRDADLGPPEVADELEDPFFHRPRPGCPRGPCRGRP